MKTLKTLSMLLLVVFTSNLLKAQVSGLGIATSTYPTKTIDYIYYTDDDRFPVSSINNGLSSGTYDITADNNPLHCPSSANINNFNAGDQVLVIQMWGGTIGTHYNATVNTNIANVLNITPVVSTTNWSLFSTSNPDDRIQIIKIPQYYNLLVDGGIVTCAKWDGYTGGILCVQVAGN